MIEDTLMKSLEHAPAMLAIVVIVMAFLRFLKGLLDSHAKRTDEFIGTVKDIHQQTLESQVRSEALTQKNIEALATNTVATKEVSAAFRNFSCRFTEK